MRVLQRVLITLHRLVKLIVAIAIIHVMDAAYSVGSINAFTQRLMPSAKCRQIGYARMMGACL